MTTNKPKIEAADIDYYVDPVNKLNLHLFMSRVATRHHLPFTFKPLKAGDINITSFNPIITTTAVGLNRVKVDLSVLIPTSVPVPTHNDPLIG